MTAKRADLVALTCALLGVVSLGAFVLELAVWAFAAWLVMLMLGAAHSIDGRVPDLGFVVVFLLLGAAYIARGYIVWAGTRRAVR